MKNLIHTAVVALFVASAAHAQQAVQWKVSDGGNGLTDVDKVGRGDLR